MKRYISITIESELYDCYPSDYSLDRVTRYKMHEYRSCTDESVIALAGESEGVHSKIFQNTADHTHTIKLAAVHEIARSLDLI